MSGLGGLIALTTLPQKFALGGGAVVLAAALTFNVVQLIENRSLSHDKTELTARIDDPSTGYVVRLSQARTNVEQCKAAVDTQNVKTRDLSKASSATVAAVQRQYDVEHAGRLRAESAAAVILARQPRGNTLAERVSDVDAQILGDLK